MLGKLAPCGGGPPILLLKPRLVVGRQRECDVPLSFPSVSSRHCELELLDGYWHVRDLGSTNGTRVNGAACTAEWLLPDDVLALSKHRYAVLYTPPPGRPPPRKTAPMPGVGARLPQPASAPAAAPVVRPPAPGAAGGGPLGKLVPCGGGPPLPLLQPRVLIGRDAGCDILLRSPAVSGRHCLLEWAGGGWSVRDLGSKNGTRVDGVRCQEQRLPPGCVLSVGPLRFQVVYAAAGAAPRPDAAPSLFRQSLLEKAGLARWRPPEAPGAEDRPPERYNLDEAD